MTPASPSGTIAVLVVHPATDDQQVPALRLVFGQLPSEERDFRVADIRAALNIGTIPPRNLIVAERGHRLVGAILTVVQPDRTAFVLPPMVLPTEAAVRQHVADELLRAVCRRIDSAGALLGQSLVAPEDRDEREDLTRNGFPHVADLSLRQRLLDQPLPPLAHVPLASQPFDPAQNSERLARLLERTYVGTLDCPLLNGMRSAADAVVSHQAAGQFDPALWHIYQADEQDAAVVLMSPHPDQQAWEVVYFGLVPEIRGRGYGRLLMLAALHAARKAGVGSVFLAVDMQNCYAMRVYEQLGFAEVAVRSVHLRPRPPEIDNLWTRTV